MLLWYILTLCAVTYHLTHAQYAYDYDGGDQCAESPAVQELACQRYTSCSLCADYVTNCYCDDICHYYNDCCPDVEPLSTLVATVPVENVECRQVLIGGNFGWVSLITSCPEGAGTDSQQNCQNGVNLMVRGEDSGLLYKNSHCAQCHGEDNSAAVTMSVFCQTDNDYKDTETSSLMLYEMLKNGSFVGSGVECKFKYVLYDEGNRPLFHECNPEVISSCPPESSEEISGRCATKPTSYVYNDKMDGTTGYPGYRNSWCAECNNDPDVNCVPPLALNSITPGRGFDSLVNLNTLSCVNQQIDAGTDKLKACDEGKFSCPQGQIYKPFQGCLADPSSDPDIQLPSGEECKMWEFYAEYEIKDELALIPSKNISSKDYVEQDGGVYVCLLKNPGSVSQYDYDRIIPSTVLTVILVILSLICILVHLTLYAVFKPLRNVPGLIVMCLISSLFTALLLFLISIFFEGEDETVNRPACAALAACQHYFFLAAFFWTNVMAFDVAGMLKATLTSSRNKKKFIWYSLYAWGCPLLFTIAGLVATSYSESDKVKIEPAFGANTCWINTKYGLLVYFLAPIFLLLLINIVLYIVSIVAIVEAARQTKMVNPGLKERFYLALKLIVVMGLPWITAALTAFIDSQALNYIFIILNASQGIFIFVSYVLTKTVFNLFKKGDFRRSRKSYSSNRTSTFSLSKRFSGNSMSNSRSVKSQRTSTTETDESRHSTKQTTNNNPIPPQDNKPELKGYTTTV